MNSTAKKTVNHSKVLTFDQLLDRWNVSKQTVYTRIHQGQLHPTKVGRNVFFNLDEVEKVEDQTATIFKAKSGPKPKLFELTDGDSDNKNKKAPPKNSAVLSVKPQYNDPAGRVASKATKLFNEGKGVREIVIELSITFDFAKQLYDDYKSCGPELHLSPSIITMLRPHLNWVENPPTAEGLVKAVIEQVTFASAKRESRSEPPKAPDPPAQKTVERVVPSEVVAGLSFDDQENKQ